MLSILQKFVEILKAITVVGLAVIITISEYVWCDSYAQLDHGCIYYTPEELAKVKGSQK